jgi:hypothetical protein
MVKHIGLHRVQPGDFIGNQAMVRQQMANRLAALSEPAESLSGPQQFFRPFEKCESLSFEITLRRQLTVMIAKRRFVLKQIKLTRTTRHEKKNHGFGASGKVQDFTRLLLRAFLIGSEAYVANQRAKRHAADPDTTLLEQMSARQRLHQLLLDVIDCF